jgi:DNA-binding response OmpR family regulator
MTTILVIEDEREIRGNISETLVLNGYEVFEAEDGPEGIDLARQQRPDLVICDVMMPDMDGYQVLASLRHDSMTATLPFIFLTARVDRASMRQGMGLGADDYITKPFSARDLLEAVEARLSRREAMTRAASLELEGVRDDLIQTIAERTQRPLASVNLALTMINQQFSQLSSAELVDLVETASSGSRYLSRQIEQMVLLSRLNTGKLRPDSIGTANYRAMLRDVWMAAMNRAREANTARDDVTIQVDEQGRGARVICDLEALRHALAEVIGNAIQVSPQGGVVQLAQWIEDDQVWFSVSDAGPGMAPRQIQAALEGDPHGIGLGLRLAARILEAHRGGLGIHSAPGEGTVVGIWLPLIES